MTLRTDPIDGPVAWGRLAAALLIGAVGNAGMWAVILVLPAVQAEFGIDRADAAIPYTLTMAGFALGNWKLGAAVDRHGAALVLAVAGLALGVAFTATALSGTFWAVCVLHAAIGFATAASFGPLVADVSHWFRRRRGLAVAAAASANYIAGGIWPLLLAAPLAAGDWRLAYLVLAAASALLMPPMALLLRRRPPEASMAAAAAAAALEARAAGFSPATLQWLLALAGLGCCVAMAMPQVHLVALCVDLGFGATAGAEMLSAMLLAGVASRLVFGLVADRLGGVPALLISSVGQALALALYLPSAGLTQLWAVSIVFGLSQGGIVPSYAVIVRERMPPAEAGARVGFVIMATIVGMAVGGWMSGWIHDMTGSYRLAFLNGIAWNLLNISVMALILWRSATPRSAAPA